MNGMTAADYAQARKVQEHWNRVMDSYPGYVMNVRGWCDAHPYVDDTKVFLEFVHG